MKLGRLFLVSIGMFALGALAQKGHYFPRSVRQLEMRLKAWSVNPEVVLAGQYTQTRERLPLLQDLDTALLPLRVRRTRLSDIFPVPKVGGAITTVGNTVIVLDRLGNLYSSLPSSRQFARLAFPPLPNNIVGYVRKPGAHLDDNTFRAYDIKFVKSARLFAVSHEYFDNRVGRGRLAVSVIDVDPQTMKPAGDWKTVFLGDPEVNGPNVEAGGKLAWKDGRLYLTIGDYEISRTSLDRSGFGKIVAIDLGTHEQKTISRGHRNPEGLLITSAGDIFSTEHGPSGGDELNLIAEGADYGWPHVTLGTDYGTYSWQHARVGAHDGYEAPAFAWVPSVGLSNLIQISGFSPRWDGDLLVGSLKATSVYRVRLDKKRIVYVEPIWIGQRVRDLAQLEDGTIVVWTDDTQLLFVNVDRSQLAENVRATKVTYNTVSDTCLYCHHFGPTKASDFAPTLSDLFDRRIASDNFRYSAGLRNKEGVWTEEALREFLHNPAEFANGTSMPRPNLEEDQFDAVVEELKRNARIEAEGSPRGSSPGMRLALAKHHSN